MSTFNRLSFTEQKSYYREIGNQLHTHSFYICSTRPLLPIKTLAFQRPLTVTAHSIFEGERALKNDPRGRDDLHKRGKECSRGSGLEAAFGRSMRVPYKTADFPENRTPVTQNAACIPALSSNKKLSNILDPRTSTAASSTR
ncbi:hypothetical protein EVAR_44840_1 [Eumeta japonica]|uniref:Uncharacterized protein n=1 Tax=Eumeta variegata TaxID=151549 RepID=A0A4C1YIW3_EUMVA|nr:hypothetical protein EVAR_44840_1 [Eumeta japonica]